MADVKSYFSGGVKWPELRWVVCSSSLPPADQLPPPPPPSTPAFLQFTSGSTSDPKGVIITHANLKHNMDIIVTNLKADDTTVVVSWLPL